MAEEGHPLGRATQRTTDSLAGDRFTFWRNIYHANPDNLRLLLKPQSEVQETGYQRLTGALDNGDEAAFNTLYNTFPGSANIEKMRGFYNSGALSTSPPPMAPRQDQRRGTGGKTHELNLDGGSTDPEFARLNAERKARNKAIMNDEVFVPHQYKETHIPQLKCGDANVLQPEGGFTPCGAPSPADGGRSVRR